MTQALDPVAAAMAKAQEAAAQAATAQQASTAVALPQANTSVATAQGPAATPVALSMETMAAGSMSVDAWFKVKEDGLKIGDMAGLLEEVTAVLDMTPGQGFILKYGIKNGNPAQYAYTTDMVNANTGGSWAAAQAKINALNPSQPAAPYRCVDLPFKLVEDVVVGKGDKAKTVAKAGDVIGYTTSTTNWKNWEVFYKDVTKAGLMDQEVLVKLTAEPKVNKAGNTWGVIKIELIGPYETEGSPD